MSKVIAAFLGAEVRQTGAEERPKGLVGSTAGGPHEGFELREAELNGIEVRTVGRQIPERGADALDRAADARDFVRGEIVGDHDVPGRQRGHEDLFDIGKETRPVDGAVEDPGRGQASHPQRGEKRTGLPPGARRVVVDAGPAEGPTIPPQEIVRNAGFVEKNQACRIPGRRGGVPPPETEDLFTEIQLRLSLTVNMHAAKPPARADFVPPPLANVSDPVPPDAEQPLPCVTPKLPSPTVTVPVRARPVFAPTLYVTVLPVRLPTVIQLALE